MKYLYRNALGEERDFDFPIGQAPPEVTVLDKGPGFLFRRVFSLAGIVFHGPGFYTTDKRPYIDVDESKVKVKGDQIVGRK